MCVLISSAATLLKRPSTTNDSSRNEAISRRRCVTTSCRHGNGFNTAGFTPPPTSRPAVQPSSVVGWSCDLGCDCVREQFVEGRRPTWPWPPGAPSCGRKRRFTVNQQADLEATAPPYSDSIHLQTYRGQPSNGSLVATADVSVRLKDNFLFVTEDFLLLRWSSEGF